MLHSLLSLGFIFFALAHADVERLKKIQIAEMDNPLLPPQSSLYPGYAVKGSEVRALRDYVSKRVNIDSRKDPEILLAILAWVSTQWQHDGMNEPKRSATALDVLRAVHEKQARYRCVEYSLVVSEVLKSLGYPARKLDIRAADSAYGGTGQGHLVAEAWSNSLRKWVFLDGQYGISATYKGELLSFYELYSIKKQGLFEQVVFNVAEGFKNSKIRNVKPFDAAEYDRRYRGFISQYFGYEATEVIRDGRSYKLVLALEGKDPFLVFQGLAYDDNLVFTHSPADFYFELNRTLATFEFRAKIGPFPAAIERHHITLKNDGDYAAQLPRFAARPDFVVNFSNNSPQHSHYEIRESKDGAWRALKSSSMNWKLDSGERRLEVRSVNKSGIGGIPSYLAIGYH